MRKPIEDFTEQLPRAAEASDEMLWFTIWLALLIGFVLSTLSWRGRQWWLLSWSIGLIGCSVGYLLWSWSAGRTG